MNKPRITAIAGKETLRAVLVAFIASIPPTILAVAVLMTSLGTSEKADVLLTKTDEIHELTNSNLTKVTANLDSANVKIRELQTLLIKMMAAGDSLRTETLKPTP